MKRVMIVLLSSSAAVCAAQAQPQTPYGPDNGFFRPSPDVALTAPKANASGPSGSSQPQPFLTLQSPGMPAASVPVPAVVTPLPVPSAGAGAPTAATAPAAANPSMAASAAPAATTPLVPPQPVLSGPQLTQSTQAWTERQMDRSVAEADHERTRAQSTPAGVGAAFDGTTSSENR